MIRLRTVSVSSDQFLRCYGAMMSGPVAKPHHAVAPTETQRQKRGGGGFTLLEVIIALAILVIGLSAIFPLFAVGTTSHKRGVDQTRISMIAPHITARLQERLYEVNPPALKDQEYADAGRLYKYDASFAPLDALESNRLAFIVKVTVRWSENAAEHSESFSTILLRRTLR